MQLVLALLAPNVVHAQFCGARPRSVRDAMPVMGLRVGTPVILSWYVGPTYFSETSSCHSYVQYFVEPGVGGGQAGLAYGKWSRERGLRLGASALRTWGPSWKAPSGRNFVGAELQAVYGIGVRVGVFRRLGSGDETRRLVTLGLVAGL